MAKYTQEEIEKISSSVSVLYYFRHLENSGKVRFERKTGHDHYFKTDDNKYSVSENSFYDFKTGEGGKIIKAVMTLENKSWKDAIDFLSEFSNVYQSDKANERIADLKKNNSDNYSQIKIQYSGVPNNEKLLSYFEERGISKEILQEHTRQIHYENNGRKYFGIGLENLSGGFEIRNPLAKIKIGKTDISEIKGTKNELIAFEGMSDMLSFLQLQKLNNNQNNRTLVSLNSITNVEKFIATYKDFNGKLFLCLDGDKAGDLATQKILKEFAGKNIKDIREFYSISEFLNNDLNDYLQKKLNINQKITNFNQQNPTQNENTAIKSRAIPETQQLESGTSRQNTGKPFEESEPKQDRNHSSGQRMGSNDDGNGLTGTERSDLGRRTGGSTVSTQHNDDGKAEGHSLGGIINSYNRNSGIR